MPKIPKQYRRTGPYVVVNRRKIPKGIPVSTLRGTHYYEGDTVEEDDVGDLVERGFLKAVRRV